MFSPPPPHRSAPVKKRRRAGVTPIQTAAMIALAGSLVAVAVPTFLRTVRRSKMAEASTELGRLHDRVAAYYAAVHEGGRRQCVPGPAGPTPEAPSVDPVDVAFRDGDGTDPNTWKALDYQPLGPVRFSYSFVPEHADCDRKATGVVAVLRAEGDLDGDGNRSLFERRVIVDRETGAVRGDVLMMRDRVE